MFRSIANDPENERYVRFNHLLESAENSDSNSNDEDEKDPLKNADPELRQRMEYLMHHVRTITGWYNEVFIGKWEQRQPQPTETRSQRTLYRAWIEREMEEIRAFQEKTDAEFAVIKEDTEEFIAWANEKPWGPEEVKMILKILRVLTSMTREMEEIYQQLCHLYAERADALSYLRSVNRVRNNTAGPVANEAERARYRLPPMKKTTFKRPNGAGKRPNGAGKQAGGARKKKTAKRTHRRA